ncbi:hypothetical protein DZC34_14765 [Clostridium botulinum]|nr:hypothetical protein DZC34_14765 [Clostridium botulinum]
MECKYIESIFKINHQELMEDKKIRNNMDVYKNVNIENILVYMVDKYGCRNPYLYNIIKNYKGIPSIKKIKETKLIATKCSELNVIEVPIKEIGTFKDNFYYYFMLKGKEKINRNIYPRSINEKDIVLKEDLEQYSNNEKNYITVKEFSNCHKNFKKIEEIFNLKEKDFEKDTTLLRAFSAKNFNIRYIIKYLIKTYGCKNKALEDILQANSVQEYGWGKLDSNYTPAFGNISIAPKNAIIKNIPVFYVRRYWTEKVGTMCYYCYSATLFPLQNEKIQDVLDENFEGNFYLNKEKNYVSMYVRH